MKLSKERLLYVGVLGVGLIGLIADRLLFQPAGAQAAAVSEHAAAPLATSAEPAPETEATPTPSPQEPSLAERLASHETWMLSPDGFHVNETWMPPPPKVEAPAEGAGPAGFSKEEFVQKYPLKGIYVRIAPEAKLWATLGDLEVELGSKIEDCTVVELSKDTVTLEREGERFTLSLATEPIKGVTVKPRGEPRSRE